MRIGAQLDSQGACRFLCVYLVTAALIVLLFIPPVCANQPPLSLLSTFLFVQLSFSWLSSDRLSSGWTERVTVFGHQTPRLHVEELLSGFSLHQKWK